MKKNKLKSRREPLKNFWNFLGSRNLSVFVFIMAMSYIFVLLIFAFLIPTWWVNNLAKLLPFQVLYVLFFINIILCIIRWLPVVINQCKKPNLENIFFEKEELKYTIEIKNKSPNTSKLDIYLKDTGFTVTTVENEKNFLYASKGRFSAIGTLGFHLSFFFLLFGATLNFMYGFEGKATVPEGSIFTSEEWSYTTRFKSKTAEIPNLTFKVDNISADFWQGRMLFTRLEAEVTTKKGSKIVTLSHTADINGSAVNISGFGYAPVYQLKNDDGKIVSQSRVILNIFAPGSKDFFFIEGYPHKFEVKFHPDYYEKDGAPASKSMDINNPAYELKIFRGSQIIFNGILKPNEWASFDDLAISFPNITRWGDFRVVKNPGNSLVWIGLILMIFSLIYRFLFYKKEVLLQEDKKGKLNLSGYFDYYKNLNVQWLKKAAELLEEGKN